MNPTDVVIYRRPKLHFRTRIVIVTIRTDNLDELEQRDPELLFFLRLTAADATSSRLQNPLNSCFCDTGRHDSSWGYPSS